LFDFETNPAITAEISIDSSGSVQTLTATINLNDVNELTVQDFSVSIDENPSNGLSLGTVEASGEGTLSYSITSATPTGALTIDAGTGELTVTDATLFDYETNPVITAEVSVDQSGSVQTLTATINLNNVSELYAQDLSAYINENPSNGQYIGAIYATGDDPISYTITAQYPDGAVDIDASTGQLTVADSALFDYEQNGSVEVYVSVENSGNTESVSAFIYISNEREIGDYAYGGVIFWMNETKDEGLVCTITDLNNGNTIQWHNGSNISTGAIATAIGTGQANTSAIVSSQGTGSYAASLCDELVLNNYSDWYLPSIDELGEIYANREIISATSSAKGGTNLSIVNWSSTEQTGNVNNAYIYIFAAGQSPSLNAKANQANVRAVRSWSDF
tara:strand:+ start:1667 stop:2839 length:1173 start_codon:yes stop_codon:yes gene_type:complete